MLTTEMQSAEALWLEIKTYLEGKRNLVRVLLEFITSCAHIDPDSEVAWKLKVT